MKGPIVCKECDAVAIEESTNSGLAGISFVQCELIRSANVMRLVHQLGVIDPGESQQVEVILRTFLNH